MINTLRRAFIPETWIERIFWSLVAIPVGVVAWQAFDRVQPSEIIERTVLTPAVKPGGNLMIRNKTIRRYPAEVTIYRTLFDGINVRHTYDAQKLPPKEIEEKYETFLVAQPIPLSATPGEARLVAVACWERPFNIVHQFWPVCVTTKTLHFTIVP